MTNEVKNMDAVNEIEDFDICLEEDDYELDENDGTLKIDKQVFDDFQKGTYINIKCLEDNGERVNSYKMISEDEDFIYCEYICEL